MSCHDLEGVPEGDPKPGWARDIQRSIRPRGSVVVVASATCLSRDVGCLQGCSPGLGNLFEAGMLYPSRSLANTSCTNSSREQSCWLSHPSPTHPLGATEQPWGVW